MRKNKQFYKEKEYIRLQKQLSENQDTQRKLGWIDLPEPVFTGYKAYLVPRADIQNRDDAWVFWYICDNLTNRSYARKIEYFSWNERRPRSHRNYMERPRTFSISEYAYNNLPPQISRWFSNEVLFQDSGWKKYGKSYACRVPDFFFDIEYEKVYRTRIKLFDNVLQQEESEIKSTLHNKFYDRREDRGAPSSFRKILNRSQRAKSKQTLYNIVYKNMDCEFEDNYRSANWYWW